MTTRVLDDGPQEDLDGKGHVLGIEGERPEYRNKKFSYMKSIKILHKLTGPKRVCEQTIKPSIY